MWYTTHSLATNVAQNSTDNESFSQGYPQNVKTWRKEKNTICRGVKNVLLWLHLINAVCYNNNDDDDNYWV